MNQTSCWNRWYSEIFWEFGTWDLSHVSSCLLGVKVETGWEAAREVKMEAVASSWLVELLRGILLQAFSGFSNVCKYTNTSNTVIQIQYQQCRATMSKPQLRKHGATVSAVAAGIEFDPKYEEESCYPLSQAMTTSHNTAQTDSIIWIMWKSEVHSVF